LLLQGSRLSLLQYPAHAFDDGNSFVFRSTTARVYNAVSQGYPVGDECSPLGLYQTGLKGSINERA